MRVHGFGGEGMDPRERLLAAILKQGIAAEQLIPLGRFQAKCLRLGKVLWEDDFPNTVVTAGKNHLLDNYIGASAFTQTGPYVGLISSVGYTAIAAADTMASHGGWNEAGNGVNYPNWSTPASNARGTPSWSAASAGSKAFSAAVSFSIATNGGTVKGCFLVLGSGAVTTNNSTAGTLFSAGLFSGGDKVLQVGDTLQVSYTLSV